MVDLKMQYAPLKNEILSGISSALDGMHLFLGENVQSFEKEFAEFCGVKHGIGVSDGTQALHILLRAFEIGPGDEVITVSHTFIATAEAIVLAGARPVFVDIDRKTMLMDVAQVEQAITPRTRDELQVFLKSKGILAGIHYPVPVHMQGSMTAIGYKQGDLPVTEQLVTEIISLPMYAELTDEEVGAVAGVITEFYAK
jgi:dTDP-4-amino-4,6-dideoxygalactose transaminase